MIQITNNGQPVEVICYCDGCKAREVHESEAAAVAHGWGWKKHKFYCDECMAEESTA